MGRWAKISCPGVILKDRNQIYLEIHFFGRKFQTRRVPGIFPLYFNDLTRFEKTFYQCCDPITLTDQCEDELVSIELIQENPLSRHGVVLATLDISVKDFIFPHPRQIPLYAGSEREILMRRTLQFGGISPKLEFSTATVIEEVLTGIEDELLDAQSVKKSISKSSAKSRGRSQQRNVSKSRKSRSTSPTKRSSMEDSRPPFVVRKVDDNIFERDLSPVRSDNCKCVKKILKKKKKKSSKNIDFSEEDYLQEDTGNDDDPYQKYKHMTYSSFDDDKIDSKNVDDYNDGGDEESDLYDSDDHDTYSPKYNAFKSPTYRIQNHTDAASPFKHTNEALNKLRADYDYLHERLEDITRRHRLASSPRSFYSRYPYDLSAEEELEYLRSRRRIFQDSIDAIYRRMERKRVPLL